MLNEICTPQGTGIQQKKCHLRGLRIGQGGDNIYGEGNVYVQLVGEGGAERGSKVLCIKLYQ